MLPYNSFYFLTIFFSSVIIAIIYIINNITIISFWIIYNIIISGINNTELNIIISDYEQLSQQIIIIIIFIVIMVYIPFFVSYFYIKIASSIEQQYTFHGIYYVYSIFYVYFISTIFNHYDFAYATFIDIFMPNIVQKCVDFSIFFIQYKGYFYDFFWIFLLNTVIVINFIIIPNQFKFCIKTNKSYSDYIKIIGIRIINHIFILYYFGNYSIELNLSIFIRNFVCIEARYVFFRIFKFIHIFKKISIIV